MKKIVPAVVVVVLVLLGLSSMFIVGEGRNALLLQFGRVVRTGFSPGLHFKLPLVQQVKEFDSRIQSLDVRPQPYATADGKSVEVSLYVKWRIADAVAYGRATGGETLQAEQRLLPIIGDGLRAQLATHTLDQLISADTTDIVKQVQQQADASGRSNLGITLVDVRIKGIDLPDEIKASLYKRMRAEQVALASALRAAGQESKTRIEAEADSQIGIIKADAERDGEKVRGDGDAQAAAIYAQAYGQDPQFYDFYRSMIAYRTSFANGKGILVLKPDSEFLRYFDNPSPAKQH